jgi:tetratricopeptide (TPR) repeat protein
VGGGLAVNLAGLDLFLPSSAFFFAALLAWLAARHLKAVTLRLRPEPYASILISGALFIFGTFILGQALDRVKASGLLKRAEALCDARRFEEALPLFQKSLALNPAEVEAWYFYGAAQQDLGRPEGLSPAAQALEAAAGLSPDFALLSYKRGALALAMKDPQAAETHWRRQTRIDPYFLPAWQALADLLASQRRVAETRAVLEEAAAWHPERPDLRRNLELLRKLR